MQSEQTDPEEGEARQQILGLMEDNSVARLYEATLSYCERFPNSTWGWLISVPALVDLGRYKDAKKALRMARALSLTQAETEALSSAIGKASAGANVSVGADKNRSSDTGSDSDADNEIEMDPETEARLCYWSCMIHKDQGNLKRAQGWIEEAIGHAEGEGSYWVTYGEILAKRGKVKQARNAHLAAIEAATSDVDEAYFNLALLLRGERRYKEALVEVNQALKIDPDYAEAHVLRQDLEAVLQSH